MKKPMKIMLLILMLGLVITLAGCSADVYNQPIGYDGGVGWVQWIVSRIAEAVYAISQFAGGYYVIGLIAITVVIRVVGWPIYSKSTAASANMQIAQPEIARLQEKYAGKKDEASQRAQQQEMMAIYKKYNINPLGCMLPLLQMPIFIAMYQTVRRIPLTESYDNLNYGFLWFNFKDEPTGSLLEVWKIGENWTFYLLAAIVGLTMFYYQRYAMKKPEFLENKKYKTAQQSQSEKTMKYMTYFMTFMLVTIAYTNLGIAFYWVLGNLFQFLQTYVNRKQTIKKHYAEKDIVRG